MFESLWIDKRGADTVINAWLASSKTEEIGRHLQHFVQHGYCIIPGAVPADLIDRYRVELNELIEAQKLCISRGHDILPAKGADISIPLTKILDVHAFSKAAQNICFAPKLQAFLKHLFFEPALAFQTLHFETGSTQAVHNDTAYVVLDEPKSLTASWVALEDVQEGSGELVYSPGSHRFGDFLYPQDRKNWSVEQDGPAIHDHHLHWLHEQARARGIELQSFRPKKGDALFWHADLAHGGGPITKPGSTCRSLVTHYCPAHCTPQYFRFIDPERRRKVKVDGGFVSSFYYAPEKKKPAGERPRIPPAVEVPGPGRVDVPAIPLADLYKPFEGLGNNCEFGIVQRHNGYDPPGLFRNVGFLEAGVMIDALGRNFEGMFEEGKYHFTRPDGWPDWQLMCSLFGFGFHTAIPATIDRETDEWIERTEKCLGVMRFLKRRFIEDLQSGEKIFVFRHKSDSSDITIDRMHAALQRHGANWLLYIVEDPSHMSGWLEMRKPGLLVAGIKRLSNENPPVIDFDAWERIARKSLALRWQPDGWAAYVPEEKEVVLSGVVPKAPMAHLEVIKHCVQAGSSNNKPISHMLIEGLDPEKLYSFELFVFVPVEFAGSQISIVNWGTASVAFNSLDLGRRGTWQRLFAQSYPPQHEQRLTPSLLATSDIKTIFYSSGWRLAVVDNTPHAQQPAPGRARSGTDVLGYAYNNGGLNNQKAALSGLVAAAFAKGRPMFLPHFFNLNHHGDSGKPCAFNAIFDAVRFKNFLQAYGIRLVEQPSHFETDDPQGWTFFKGNPLFRTPAGFDVDFAKSLFPVLGNSQLLETLVQRAFIQENIRLVLQLRVEQDWARHAEHTLKPTIGADEDYYISYLTILRKVAETLPASSNRIYVACDEGGLPASKQEIRNTARSNFGMSLFWKSDFMPDREMGRMSALELSILDFEMALRANLFVGLTRSTFSNRVTWEKFCRTGTMVTTHYIYNLRGDRLAQRTDNGAFSDPERATSAATGLSGT